MNGCRIAVLMGGISGEREVSLSTGQCVATRLASRHLVKPVEIRACGAWIVPQGFLGQGLDGAPPWTRGAGEPILAALRRLEEDDIDVVFNALHGPGGEDGSIQGLFEHAGMPCTGPGCIPAAVTMDKCITKDALRGAGLPTPRSLRLDFALSRCGGRRRSRNGGSPGAVDPNAAEALDTLRLAAIEGSRELPFPWFAKPRRLGSSVGVEVIRSEAEFAAWALERLRREAAGGEDEAGCALSEYFVEELVRGRELTCAVLETDGEPRALPPIEIRPRSSAFFDYHAKYTAGASEEICPAPLGDALTREIEALAVRVHELFGCEPLSRTDFFLEEDGGLTILEVNTLPGMTPTSLVPLAARTAGIGLEDLFSSLVEHALERAGRRSACAMRSAILR